MSDGGWDAATTSGLRSITLRRICFAILLSGVAVGLAYRHDVEQFLFWYLVLALYGIVVAGAVQHVYRHVRVGRLETATMVATTVVFTVAMALAPRPVGVRHTDTTTTVRVPDNPYPIPSVHGTSTSLYNAPLLALVGHRTSTSVEPWYTVALALALVATAGICTQWVLVARLGRHRRGVFNPYVSGGGPAAFTTLDAPLGTSVTRPASIERPERRPRS